MRTSLASSLTVAAALLIATASSVYADERIESPQCCVYRTARTGVNMLIVDSTRTGRRLKLVNNIQRVAYTDACGLAEDVPAHWVREGERIKLFDAETGKYLDEVIVHLGTNGGIETIVMPQTWNTYLGRRWWHTLSAPEAKAWIEYVIIATPAVITLSFLGFRRLRRAS